MAQIIIAKHRKGRTDDVLLTFRGEFTRFENPEDGRLTRKPAKQDADNGGEILGSKINGGIAPMPGTAFDDPFGGEPLPPPDMGPMPF